MSYRIRSLARLAGQVLSCAFVLHGTAFAAGPQSPTLPVLPEALRQAAPASILPTDPAKDFVFRDDINGAERPGTFKVVRHEDGGPVFLADNPKASKNYNGIGARWSSSAPVRKGDVLLARFAARALKARQESGEAEGVFIFEAPGAAEVRVVQTFSVGPDWTVISVPFTVPGDVAPSAGKISLTFGNLEQSIEFARFDVLSFGKRAALADLPATRFSYVGREADAAWRRAALARIEQIRTAPFTIEVVDARGRPVEGARVEAAMTQAAFLWGTAVSAERLMAPDAERYRQEVKALFNTAVIENGLKWPRYRDPGFRATALKALDWINANGLRAKGHNLVWPGWKFSPPDIVADPQRGEKLPRLIEEHIRDITRATHGKLIGWDVVNEPLHETDYFQHMPREEVAKWFKMAEQSDPRLQLTLNEYAMLNRSSSPLFIKEFKEFVTMLRKNGARIDVLGVQGHVGQTPRAPSAVLSDLDLLAEGGNQVQITEFDINTKDEALQGDYTRDFLIATYSHPAVSGFIKWGFWEAQHWKPDAAMFRKDWSAKPSLAAWKDLVVGQWKTRVNAASGADGQLRARGHFGTYLVTVEHGGKRVQQSFELGKQGAQVKLRLP